MPYPMSFDVVYRDPVDVFAKTPYCMTDVCGVVSWNIPLDILEDNDGHVGPSLRHVFADML